MKSFWSIERVVLVLTPLFSAAAGAISTGAGAATGIPSKDYVVLFGFGAASGLGAAIKWLHGRQKFVQFETDTEKVVAKFKAVVEENKPVALALTDIEGALKSHTNQIVKAIGDAVHLPPSAQEVADQILAKAAGNAAALAQAPTNVVPITDAPSAPVGPGPVSA